MRSATYSVLFVVVAVASIVILQGCGAQPDKSGTTSMPASTAETNDKPTLKTSTTTESAITTETPNTTLSPFDSYVSAYPDACKPFVTRSDCSDDEFAGSVLFFHGFSACATQVKGLAGHLSKKCFDVLVPTSPGHGKRPIKNCDDPSNSCTVRVTGGGFDLSELPVDGSDYTAFVDEMNELMRQERNHRAAGLGMKAGELEFNVGGLSLGAAMAFIAADRNPGFYKRQLLINGYLAMGREEADQDYYTCMKEGNPEKNCTEKGIKDWEELFGTGGEYMSLLAGKADTFAEYERKIFGLMVRMSDHIQGAKCEDSARKNLDAMFDVQMTWSSVCPNIFHGNTVNRGGFCSFLHRHILATQSFALHGLQAALQAKVPSTNMTQIFLTERDGMTRNGLVYVLADSQAALTGSQVSLCMYRFKEGWDRGNPAKYYSNSGSMPHANIDGADNPDGAWWIDDLFAKITMYLTSDSPVQGAGSWDGSKEMCVQTPLGVGLLDDTFLYLPDAAVRSAKELAPPNSLWYYSLGCMPNDADIVV